MENWGPWYGRKSIRNGGKSWRYYTEYLSKLNYFTAGIGKMHFYPQRALNGFHQTILDESGRIKDPDLFRIIRNGLIIINQQKWE